MDLRVGVQALDPSEQLALGRRGGEVDLPGPEADLFGIAVLHSDVGLAGRIVTHQNRREPGYLTVFVAHGADVLGDLLSDLARRLRTRDDLRAHELAPASSLAMVLQPPYGRAVTGRSRSLGSRGSRPP